MVKKTMQVDLKPAPSQSVHARLADALTLSFAPDHVDTFDRSGRLISTFRAGRHLRRGLDGRVLARWRPRGGPRQRQWLDVDEREQLLAEVRQEIKSLLEVASEPELKEVLRRAYQFDYTADVAAFHRVYEPISILPPDQYQALVLQATEGCSFNTCIFCALYRDRPFRIKRPPEFAEHIRQALAYFGEGILLRRSIFLADANALIVPQPRLLPLLDVLAQTFTVMPRHLPPREQHTWLRRHPLGMRGIYAFVDGLSAERKSVEDFRELWRRGVRRVYIGLESGCEALLTWLRKPSSAAMMLDAVKRMKAAGLQVGVIVLTGVGGERFHDCHCRDTATVLNAMPLDRHDIIYFSPFVADPGAPYEAIARAERIEPPTPARIEAQEQAIRAGLTHPFPPTGPKRVPYNLRDFVY